MDKLLEITIIEYRKLLNNLMIGNLNDYCDLYNAILVIKNNIDDRLLLEYLETKLYGEGGFVYINPIQNTNKVGFDYKLSIKLI